MAAVVALAETATSEAVVHVAAIQLHHNVYFFIATLVTAIYSGSQQ